MTNADILWELDEVGREVLFRLPAEPCGMSAGELADGILLARSKASITRIEAALATIRRLIGLIDERMGIDTFGVVGPLYGLPGSQMVHVRRFAACVTRGLVLQAPAPACRQAGAR